MRRSVLLYRPCLWACLQRAGGRCLATITRNCVHRSSPNWVCRPRCRYSDHLQLIKFWRSCAPGKGVCGEAKISGSAFTASVQCLRLSGRFFHYYSFRQISICIGAVVFYMDRHSCPKMHRLAQEYFLESRN